MEPFVVFYRLVAISIVVAWVVQIAYALRQPPEWQPRRAETLPFRLTRNAYIACGVLGVVAGTVIFALSFFLFP